MANPGTVNPVQMFQFGGMDEILGNARTRASTAQPLGVNWIEGAGTPTTGTPGASVTLTAANLLTGIITFNPSVANTATFDTAANIVAAVNTISAGAVVGDYISALIINGSAANTITLAVPASSFDTNQPNRVIAVNASRWVIIRLTNVTSGSEAYVVYF